MPNPAGATLERAMGFRRSEHNEAASVKPSARAPTVAAMSAMKQRESEAASSWLKGGDSRVLLVPAHGALHMTPSAIGPCRSTALSSMVLHINQADNEAARINLDYAANWSRLLTPTRLQTVI